MEPVRGADRGAPRLERQALSYAPEGRLSSPVVSIRSAGVGVAVGVLALGLGLVLVLLRGDPYVASDQGVFLSVAGRMLDGDRLYSDVLDNKDPLFYYTYAGALWVGSTRLIDNITCGPARKSQS